MIANTVQCDGARPVCKTCAEKGRQCIYQALDPPGVSVSQPLPNPQQTLEDEDTIRQAQAANIELSELEKMKKELEEAKARIQQLEDKSATT